MIRIINHDIYQVAISLGDNLNNEVWIRSFLGAPTQEAVEALLTELITNMQKCVDVLTGLPDMNCLAYQQCLYLVKTYGVPSPDSAKQYIMRSKLVGHIRFRKIAETTQVSK